MFQDPVSGKFYLYWGNGFMAGAELGDDMTSLKLAKNDLDSARNWGIVDIFGGDFSRMSSSIPK